MSESWMNAPRGGGRCRVCGRPLDAEPHFAEHVVGPNARRSSTHVACYDFSGDPWPYDKALQQVRSRYRALRLVLRELEAYGRWLSERKRLWPEGAAETMDGVARRREALRELFERAGWKR